MGGSGGFFKFLSRSLFRRPMAEPKFIGGCPFTVVVPTNVPVSTFCTTTKDKELFCRDPDHPTELTLADWELTEVMLCKDKAKAKHEYIMATVKVPEPDGRPAELLIDLKVERFWPNAKETNEQNAPTATPQRQPGSEAPRRSSRSAVPPPVKATRRAKKLIDRASAGMRAKKTAAEKIKHSTTASSSAASKSSLEEISPAYLRPGKANDLVNGYLRASTRKLNLFDSGETTLLGKVTLKNATFLDLIAVLNLVTSSSEDYTLLENQCYWFAFAIYDMLFLNFGPNPHEDSVGHRRLSPEAITHTEGPGHVPLKTNTGVWRGIMPNREWTTEKTLAFLVAYNSKIEEFLQYRDQDVIAKAKLEAERKEAERRIAEAERRVAEAERRVAEAERRAEANPATEREFQMEYEEWLRERKTAASAAKVAMPVTA